MIQKLEIASDNECFFNKNKKYNINEINPQEYMRSIEQSNSMHDSLLLIKKNESDYNQTHEYLSSKNLSDLITNPFFKKNDHQRPANNQKIDLKSDLI